MYLPPFPDSNFTKCLTQAHYTLLIVISMGILFNEVLFRSSFVKNRKFFKINFVNLFWIYLLNPPMAECQIKKIRVKYT